MYAAVAVGLVASGCGRGRAPGGPPPAARGFTDVSESNGVHFRHERAASADFLLPEIMGGGGGFLDADGDGLLDIYLVQSGSGEGGAGEPATNRLLRNRGDGTFADVTEASGVGDAGYGMGCAAGDYDNDGDVDLYVTNLGPNVLFRNEGGGVFTDQTAAAGVGDPGWSTSSAFVDFDGDGDLDLFVVNYVAWSDAAARRECFAPDGSRDYCSPQAYAAPSRDTLYRNEGDGRFTDVSSAAGLGAAPGTGLGVVCTDLDGDGRVDIYVSNDQMPSVAWVNRGDGTFEDQAAALGVAVDEMGRPQAGMGVDAGDVDGDGDLDLWKVHLHRETHILYQRQDGGYFDDATVRLGLAGVTRRFTGFGTALVDLDLDGRLDIFVANGRVQRGEGPGDPYAEPDQVLLQEAERTWFRDVSERWLPDLVESGRAAAFGDYDNDGDMDVLVVNCGGRARLLRNDGPRVGHFLTLRVVDGRGRDAYGARVTCEVAGRRVVREVRAAFSYCATNDPRLNLGLGAARRVDRVEVRWPDGVVTEHGPFEADRFQTLSR
jgi:hypothetical protein